MKSCAGFDAELVPVRSVNEALEFLNFEVPDLAFINFSDPAIDGFALLECILKDPWLLNASIVAFCNDYDTSERVEKTPGTNLIASLAEDDVEKYLAKILGIIVKNQRILFQRGIGFDLVQALSASYQLHNDTIEANCYANMLCNFLYNANKIDSSGKMQISIAMTEMLINGIEHGNCGVTYAEKSAWLEDGNMMRDLIAKKCDDPAVRDKRVLFEYTIAPTNSTFLVADEGPGFDWRGLKDPAQTENVYALHGRGIKMTRKYTKNLTYNDKGNAVTFEIEHLADCANAQPALFEHIAPLVIRPGDIVFKEGEAGDFLYYVAKGRYDVIVKGEVFSALSADDILMGEMAFLLGNRRTATVRATTDGALIQMSKKDFVLAIKENPHYGLFLAWLLAERLQRRHPKDHWWEKVGNL
ncbi:MAG: cyclic nucleotide-binding domain-containing protein [Gemmataceae bacterium]|nr:cyclic nucleotide-binding domain-containing protein [Gemmataceae bacterium]